MHRTDTKLAILDAAERAFAENGFERVSIRRIVAAAGVNIAAVHYHFGSKEALIEAVFNRRIQPINARRLEMLEALENASTGGALPLGGVVQALVEPMLELKSIAGETESHATRIYGRVIAESSRSLQTMLRRQFGPVLERFAAAFARALPDLPKPVLLWRITFSVGATAHIMCDPARLKEFSGGVCDTSDSTEVIRQLTRFLTAGLQAPVF